MGLWDSIKRLFGRGQSKPSQGVRKPSTKASGHGLDDHSTLRRQSPPIPPASSAPRAPAPRVTTPIPGPARAPGPAKPAPVVRPAALVPPVVPESRARPVVSAKAPAIILRAPLPDDLLQYSSSPPAKPLVPIVVGFDFGTSSSKVVLQTPYKLTARAIPVNFGSFGHPMLPFLLPSAITEQPDGRYALGLASNGSPVYHDLKVRLLASSSPIRSVGSEDEHLSRAGAYVALALRESRRRFLADDVERENYKMDRLQWSMNLGIPSAGYDDEIVRDRFELVARVGWLLSLSPSAPTFAMAREAVLQIRNEKAVGIDINVIPEVAAEVVGYAKSRQRNDGLHFILDVGASTLDLCAFVLHADRGDDVYELLAADVKPLGLLALHDARMQAAKERPPFDRWPADLTVSIPDWKSIADLPAGIRRDLQRADEEYVNTAARQVLLRMIDYVRQRRDPNADGWRTGVPLFLCGGGSNHESVPRIFSLADSTGRSNWTGYRGLKPRSLPVPSQLVGDIAPDMYQSRMSVAYGLSFPGINIGPINPPTSIDDVREPDRFTGGRWKERFVDKDQV